jgi:hypothetical protein
MSKVKLPSGAELEINLAPFSDANALNKAVARELAKLKLDKEIELNDPSFLKDLVCAAIASEDIMAALWVCFKRCTYSGLRITSETFEPEEARGDYFIICKEVLQANCLPFIKSLLSQFGADLAEKKA